MHLQRVERGTLLGSIEYCACAVMEKSAVARMAVEILNEGISRILFEFVELDRRSRIDDWIAASNC